MTPKQRYFEKVYATATEVECACGCGGVIRNKDRFGRDKKFISGHNGRKYFESGQYKREWNHRHRRERHEYRTDRITRLKLKLIALAGNKCIDCGYECDGTNGRAFDFHHRIPRNKKFPLNAASIDRRAWSAIVEEVKKCILLCATCHRLRH